MLKNFKPDGEVTHPTSLNYYLVFKFVRAAEQVEVRTPTLETESFPSLFLTLTLLSLGFYSLTAGTKFCVAANFFTLGYLLSPLDYS